MKVLVSEKISSNRYKTSEGYLICKDSILARTGKQTYKHNQVYDNSNDSTTDVEVDRKPEQVFSPEAIASFENKPITIQHPDEQVNSNNYRQYATGFARDVRKANIDGQDVLVGNLVVTDDYAISEIEDGLKYLSCGYECDIIQSDKPEQINIRGNHIALCDNPRAGITMIQDSHKQNMIVGETPHFIRILTDALDSKYVDDSIINDDKLAFLTQEYPRDSKEWLKYMASELKLKVKVTLKELYKDDKVYIEGSRSDIDKLVNAYNNLYSNRKLVQTSSTEINKNRLYNIGYYYNDSKDEELDGGLADNISIESIAKKHNVEVDKIVEQLIKGIDVELEHTNDKKEATEIAKDHLFEMPDYYDKLNKMETNDALYSSYDVKYTVFKNGKNQVKYTRVYNIGEGNIKNQIRKKLMEIEKVAEFFVQVINVKLRESSDERQVETL